MQSPGVRLTRTTQGDDGRVRLAPARPDEVTAARPGDDLVTGDPVVMDRGCSFDATPEVVWPWLEQLGKDRAGWYLPITVERFLPPSRRAIRHLDDRWLGLAVDSVVPDYGGRHETFTVAAIDPPRSLVHRSRRGGTEVSWSLTLTPEEAGTRLHLRLRLGPVRHRRLAEVAGGLVDALTVAGMAAGLRERLR